MNNHRLASIGQATRSIIFRSTIGKAATRRSWPSDDSLACTATMKRCSAFIVEVIDGGSGLSCRYRADVAVQLALGRTSLTRAIEPRNLAQELTIAQSDDGRLLGAIWIWPFGSVFFVAGVNVNEPCLISLREALNAGVDLLLVAYDGSQYYSLFACVGRIRAGSGILLESVVRLTRTPPAGRNVLAKHPNGS